MKVVEIKFKKGIRKKIRDTQKAYEYMCPINEVNVGDFVLVEVKIRERDDFQVGRIESVTDVKDYTNETGLMPYGFVICKLPVQDFEGRLQSVRKMKNRIYWKNQKTLQKKEKKKKKKSKKSK